MLRSIPFKIEIGFHSRVPRSNPTGYNLTLGPDVPVDTPELVSRDSAQPVQARVVKSLLVRGMTDIIGGVG